MPQGGGDRDLFLRSSREIEHVKQHGRRLSTAYFNLLTCRVEGEASRVGIVVGRRFGNAVRRNRAKRLFRELTRLVRTQLVAGQALLVFPKRDALTQPFDSLKEAWRTSLKRHRVLRLDEE